MKPVAATPLALKIGFAVVIVEVITLLVLGTLQTRRFSAEVDKRLKESLRKPGTLLANGSLRPEAVSELETMRRLVGDGIAEAMIVQVDGKNIFQSLDPQHLGREVTQLPQLKEAWFTAAIQQPLELSTSDGTNTFLVNITPLISTPGQAPFLFSYVKLRTTEAETEKREIRQRFFAGSFFGILATSFAILVCFRWLVASRLDRIGEAARRMAGGDYEARVGGQPAADELGLLHAGFDSMATQLQQTIAELQRTIVELRSSESARRENEENFRRLFESAPVALLLIRRRDSGVILVNQALDKLHGPTPASLVGIHAGGFYRHPEDRLRLLARLAAHGRVDDFEIEGQTATGEIRFVRVSAVALQYHSEEALLVGVVDFTDRRHAEAALRASEQNLFQFLEASPIGVFVMNGEGRTYFVNRNGKELLGQGIAPEARPEDISRVYQAYVAGTDRPYPTERLPIVRALAGERVSVEDIEIHRPDRVVPLQVWAAPIRDDTGQITYAIAAYADITDRRQAEVALQESEQRYRAVVEFSPEGIIVAVDDRLVYANTAAVKMLGAERPDNVLGRLVYDFAPPDFADRARARRQEVLRTGVAAPPVEGEVLRLDGTRLAAEFHAIPFVFAGRPAILNLIRDLTQQKQAGELRAKLEAQLRQAQKMEAVGQLAGGIAHDFNNLLTVIRGNASLLQLDKLPPEEQGAAKEIMQASDRAANLTRQLLTFSRRQVLQIHTLDLNDVVANLTKMLHRLIGEHIVLHTRFTPGGAFVLADAGMIEQVLVNLAVNARDAMPEGGELTLSTGSIALDEAAARVRPNARAGQFVTLNVSDTGTGISPENLSRIFEPFFTTKEVGKGTGLGLATVFGIVQQHEGWIEVESQTGAGTQFHIYLPAARPVVAPAPVVAPKTMPGGTETILVVEDDPALRALANRVLRRCGYRVLEAATGKLALQVWSENQAEIQLLLTDMVMPDGMTGRELGTQLLQANPKLKIIYTSGYSSEIAGRNADDRLGAAFLQKPFDLVTLATTVRETLDGR